MDISYVPNAGNIASEIKNELLDVNDDRSNLVLPRTFTASNFPRTKIMQKVVDFGFFERPVFNWEDFNN